MNILKTILGLSHSN